MFQSRPYLACASALLAGALGFSATQSASAETHLLVMGGGSSPTSNQISLEKNVNYFYRVLDHLGLKDAPRDILFACGDEPTTNDVVYNASASDDPEVVRLIDMLVGPGKAISKQFRPHDIGGGEITSSKDNIVKWFDDHAGELEQDDKLLIYFTGHGGRGTKEDKQNTSLYLWPKHNIRMDAFTTELDKMNPDTPVVMVMVQCFSGGFANVIFNEGDPAKGLSDYNRCGFYAAVHSRPAAGCTPHVNEADYKEYSSYFWAALSGEDRVGEPVVRPDYDGDGETTYLEAHAYAIIHSDSTDLSMTTTDRMARALEVVIEDQDAGQLSTDSAYPDLYAAADPTRRAMLDGLSQRLNLVGDDRTAQARAALERARKDRGELFKRRRELGKQINTLRKELVDPISERWPGLADPKNGDAPGTVVEHAEPIRLAIAGQSAFAELNDKLDELERIGDERDALTATIAHAERYLYTCESVAKIDTLLRFGTPEQVAAYERLLAREMATPSR
ncbi:MAG: hypothetical protein ACE37H_13400 [Phycisphaeraceae bacterium]